MRALWMLCVVASGFPLALTAQADGALAATRATDFVVLSRSESGALSYAVDRDGRDRVMHPLKEGQLLSVRNGGSLNVMLRYLNPLRFTWSIANKEVDEPLVAASGKFLESASSLFALVAGGTAAAGSIAAASADATLPGAFKAFAELEALAERPGTTQHALAQAYQQVWDETVRRWEARGAKPTLKPFFDPALQEWDLWLISQPGCLAGEADAIGRLRDAAFSVDQLLHGAGDTLDESVIQTGAAFRSVFSKAVRTLADASSVSALRAARGEVTRALALLQNATKTGDEGLASLRQRAGDLKESNVSSDLCKALTAYTKSVVSSFVERSKPAMAARVTVVSEFQRLHTEIGKVIPADNGEVDFHVGQVTLAPGKRTEVTVTIGERTVAFNGDRLLVESKGTSTAKLQVMDHQSLIVDFVGGVAYSNVAYPRFKTNDANGSSVVADAGIDRPRMLAVGMLNLIPNMGWSGFTRLVGQVGLGATTESPVLLAGGGIRITSPSAAFITLGVALPFVQRLKTLKVGDAVGGAADLEKDLERTLSTRPSLYIGIQR